MRLRKAQLERLGELRAGEFKKRVAEFLRSEARNAGTELEGVDLDATIDSSMARARRYGITTERNSVQLVLIQLGLGNEFDEGPENAWARDILERRSLSQDSRMRLLTARARERMGI